MENNRGSKVIAIAALLVAVVGLSIGFAAFSNTLKISSGATVTPDSDTFKVRFSASEDTTTTAAVNADGGETGATGTPASINNANTEVLVEGKDAVVVPKISGLNAQFTKPGQTVTYSFWIRNDGEYVAYLKSITMGAKSCQKSEGSNADQAKVTAACGDITMTVKVGDVTYSATDTAITNQSIGTDSAAPVVVTIDYAATANSPVDGPFEVSFGETSLVYSSVQ